MNRISFSAQKQDESPRIVLTADETMMSKYRWGIFVGFSTCMPRGIIPDWFFLVSGLRRGRRRAIELVADLKGTRSLLVPMNFVSMRGSTLDNKETFTMKKMRPEHWQLFGECVDHYLKVVPELISIQD